MIDKALTVLVTELNAYLNNRLGVTGGERAVLGPVPDATKDPSPEHPLTLSLVRVEEERITKSQSGTRTRDSIVESIQPDIKLNLFLLVSAHGTSYPDALKLLSAAVAFFQSRPFIDHAGCPALDASIEKLIIEMCSQTFEEQNHLWGSLSTRYVPSVAYRVRMLIIQEGTPLRITPAIRSMDPTPMKV